MTEQKKTEKRQQKTNIRVLCFLLLFSLSVSVFAVVQDYFWCRSDRILHHVSIFGTDLSGCSFEQAKRILSVTIKERSADILTLTYKDSDYRYSCGEMGFPLDETILLRKAEQLGREGDLIDRLSFRFSALWHDISLEDLIDIDDAKLTHIVYSVRDQLDTTAKNAYFYVDSDGNISIVPSVKGSYLDSEKTKSRLISSMKDQRVDTVALVVSPDSDPSQTTEDLEAMNINGLLATFSTYYSESAVNRAHNVSMAASFLDGTVIRSGESFSFNDRVGERTRERGFLDAPIIENGHYSEGLGGGVCQVSSTLYGAVLRTEMEVTARRPHSLVSTYVSPGQDAMVSWGLSDLIFVNTYKTPILLYAHCDGGELTVSVYGDKREKKEISVTSEILRYIPYKTEIVIDPDLPKGSQYIRSSGKRGLECAVYRTVSHNGKVLKTETVSHDIYSAQKEVIVSAP